MSNLAQNLRPAQIALLETIRPLEKWVCELSQYNENGDFWWIQEVFCEHDKYITFDDFYYAGIDRTPVIDASDLRLEELRGYERIRNTHYHEIAGQAVHDFEIGTNHSRTLAIFSRR